MQFALTRAGVGFQRIIEALCDSWIEWNGVLDHLMIVLVAALHAQGCLFGHSTIRWESDLEQFL